MPKEKDEGQGCSHDVIESRIIKGLRSEPVFVIGEVRSDKEFVSLSKGFKFPASYDPYVKRKCDICGKNFAFRMDSIEVHFQTCPYCGYANALGVETNTEEMRETATAFYGMKEGLEKYSRLGEYTIPLDDIT